MSKEIEEIALKYVGSIDNEIERQKYKAFIDGAKHHQQEIEKLRNTVDIWKKECRSVKDASKTWKSNNEKLRKENESLTRLLNNPKKYSDCCSALIDNYEQSFEICTNCEDRI